MIYRTVNQKLSRGVSIYLSTIQYPRQIEKYFLNQSISSKYCASKIYKTHHINCNLSENKIGDGIGKLLPDL